MVLAEEPRLRLHSEDPLEGGKGLAELVGGSGGGMEGRGQGEGVGGRVRKVDEENEMELYT